ncbi:hypothetical protein NPIL_597111 [Nephila pilipes]|uniref:Uncharacterized protein n=1 Tax=Nephila pilipes TaxID=299642 RepID=A0A8X6NC53_NEPPI|nr:hypothetical protein NPIL_597111 [Nephila pilipes]
MRRKKNSEAFGFHLIGGSIESFLDEKTPVHCGFIHENDETQLKPFFDLESIGIRDDPHCYDDDKELETFNETVSFENNPCTFRRPWNKNCYQLGDSYYVAQKKMKNVERGIG